MHGEFGLDAEALGGGRKRLHEAPRHDAIAGQHVVQLDAEHQAGQSCQQAVAEHMATAIGGGARRLAPSRNDIQPFVDQLGDEHRRGRGIVSVIAVDQNVYVGLDVGEHAAHHIALADDCAGRFRARHGRIAGIVVVDID